MERPFDYPGSHSDIVSPDPYHMVRAEGAGSIYVHHGETGEYSTTITPWIVPNWWTAEDINSVVGQRFEAEYCRHSYDCCGHIYPGRGRVVDISHITDDEGRPAQLVLVKINYTQNI